MKRIIALALLPFILSACGSDEYVHSTEPRSNVYYGQPIADLYENFGAPTKATQLTENERVLIYIKQEIEKDWAYRYVRGCVMKFFLKDERVIAWSADGQACVIPSTGGNITELNAQRLSADLPNNAYGLFDEWTNTTDVLQYSPTGGQVPADAFDGKAPTTYKAVHNTQENIPEVITDTHFNGRRLPADAFDGKASTSYRPIKTPIRNNASTGLNTLPPDAFEGQASTIYNPSKTIQSNTNIHPSSASMLPSDAFEGQASTVYQQPASSKGRSLFSADEEEWGLFDN